MESEIKESKFPIFQIKPLSKLSLIASFLNLPFLIIKITSPDNIIPKHTGKKKSWVATLPSFKGTNWLPQIAPAKTAAAKPFLVFWLSILPVALINITPAIINPIPKKPAAKLDGISPKTNPPHKKDRIITKDDETGTALANPKLGTATKNITLATAHNNPLISPYGLKFKGNLSIKENNNPDNPTPTASKA